MRLWIQSAAITTITTALLILMAVGPKASAQRIITSQSDIDLARFQEKLMTAEAAITVLVRKSDEHEKAMNETRLELAAQNGRMQGFGAALVALQLLHLGLLFFSRKKEH